MATVTPKFFYEGTNVPIRNNYIYLHHPSEAGSEEAFKLDWEFYVDSEARMTILTKSTPKSEGEEDEETAKSAKILFGEEYNIFISPHKITKPENIKTDKCLKLTMDVKVEVELPEIKVQYSDDRIAKNLHVYFIPDVCLTVGSSASTDDKTEDAKNLINSLTKTDNSNLGHFKTDKDGTAYVFTESDGSVKTIGRLMPNNKYYVFASGWFKEYLGDKFSDRARVDLIELAEDGILKLPQTIQELIVEGGNNILGLEFDHVEDEDLNVGETDYEGKGRLEGDTDLPDGFDYDYWMYKVEKGRDWQDKYKANQKKLIDDGKRNDTFRLMERDVVCIDLIVEAYRAAGYEIARSIFKSTGNKFDFRRNRKVKKFFEKSKQLEWVSLIEDSRTRIPDYEGEKLDEFLEKYKNIYVNLDVTTGRWSLIRNGEKVADIGAEVGDYLLLYHQGSGAHAGIVSVVEDGMPVQVINAQTEGVEETDFLNDGYASNYDTIQGLGRVI